MRDAGFLPKGKEEDFIKGLAAKMCSPASSQSPFRLKSIQAFRMFAVLSGFSKSTTTIPVIATAVEPLAAATTPDVRFAMARLRAAADSIAAREILKIQVE